MNSGASRWNLGETLLLLQVLLQDSVQRTKISEIFAIKGYAKTESQIRDRMIEIESNLTDNYRRILSDPKEENRKFKRELILYEQLCKIYQFEQTCELARAMERLVLDDYNTQAIDRLGCGGDYISRRLIVEKFFDDSTLKVVVHIQTNDDHETTHYTLPNRSKFMALIESIPREKVKTIEISFKLCPSYCKCGSGQCELPNLDDEFRMWEITHMILKCGDETITAFIVSQFISTFNLKRITGITIDTVSGPGTGLNFSEHERYPCFLPENQIVEIIVNVAADHYDEDFYGSSFIHTIAHDCFALTGCKTIVVGSCDVDWGRYGDYFWFNHPEATCSSHYDGLSIIVLNHRESIRAKYLREKYRNYNGRDFIPKAIYEIQAETGKTIFYDCREQLEPTEWDPYEEPRSSGDDDDEGNHPSPPRY